MMRCKEVRRLLDQGYGHYGSEYYGHDRVTAHARQCDKCHDAIALDRLSRVLLKAVCDQEVEHRENPFLLTRIKARIREHGVGSWESAILALRGWLFAFGAAAILLLTISVQWQPGNPTDQDNDAMTLSSLSDDFISGNINNVDK